MLNNTPLFGGPFGPGGFELPVDVTDGLEGVIGGAGGDGDAPADGGDDAPPVVDGVDDIPDAGDGDVTTDEPSGSGSFAGVTAPDGFDGPGDLSAPRKLPSESIMLPTTSIRIPPNFAEPIEGFTNTLRPTPGASGVPGILPSFFGFGFNGAEEIVEPTSPFDFSDAIFDLSIDFPVFINSIPPLRPDIDVGETVTGFIGDIDDVDLFEVDLQAGQTVIIDAFATEDSNLDTLLAVVDRFGNTLVENDDFNIFESFDSKIVFTAPETAEFTIAVGGFFSSVGEFGLSVVDFSDGLTDVQELALLYEAAFGRAADSDGLNFWLDALQSGVPLDVIAEQFVMSDEFTNLFGDVDTLSDTAIVTILFSNVLDRDPDPEGLDFFRDLLREPDVDVADLLVSFARSPENAASSPEVFLLETDGNGDVPADSDFFLFAGFFF